MFLTRFLPAAAALFLTAAPGLSLTLECKIPSSNAGGGFITDLYVFQYDEDSGKAIAADGLIYYYNDDQPMVVKVSDDTAKKLVLTWNVQITAGNGQLTKMQFRATYFKADKSVTVRAVPGGGYSNDFEGRGKCKSV
jgi:hypothetical protein